MAYMEGYLVVTRKKPNWGGKMSARWLEKRPKETRLSEVVVHVTIEIPNEIFDRPQLTARITVDKDQVPPAEISKEVLVKASELLRAQTGFRVEFVPEPPIESKIEPEERDGAEAAEFAAGGHI